MDLATLLTHSSPFLGYLVEWDAALPNAALSSLFDDTRQVAILCVDVINGFFYSGPLASSRVKSIIIPIVDLFEHAHAAGVRHFLLPQDTHEPEAVEFGQYPPHGIRGTEESDTVPELKALPFYKEMIVFAKNSISPALNTGLENWLMEHPEVNTFITVGDCTDLCICHLAMFLRLRANAYQLQQRVILPVNCVETYDLPVETAQQLGAVPHDGDLLHLIFLYSMMLNGVKVVRSIS